MPHDHKFERKYDRRAVPEDEKERILDLRDFHMEPPSVGIYEGECRYFKANKLWCKYIFGLLTWMQHPAYWTEAEDTDYHAIQQIMIFEEGIESGMLMDPEQYEQATYSAIYRAVNDVAKQIVSGRITGITVDDEGNVTSGEDVEVPEVPDDPLTPEDERSEAKAGSAIRLALEINRFYGRISGLFGVDITPDVPVEEAIQWMTNFYNGGEEVLPFNAAMEEYWIRRAAGDPVVDFLEDLPEWLYCEGMTFESVYALITLQETDSDSADNGVELLGLLDSDWFNLWIMEGSSLPSTAYIAWPCTPVNEETFDLDMSTGENVQYTTNAVHKAGHRIRIEVSGTFVDADNPTIVQDFFYQHDTTTGIKTFVPALFQIQGGAGSLDEPEQADVPFQASHAYRITLDIDEFNPAGNIIFGRVNTPFNLPNTTGILSFVVTDLGQYA